MQGCTVIGTCGGGGSSPAGFGCGGPASLPFGRHGGCMEGTLPSMSEAEATEPGQAGRVGHGRDGEPKCSITSRRESIIRFWIRLSTWTPHTSESDVIHGSMQASVRLRADVHHHRSGSHTILPAACPQPRACSSNGLSVEASIPSFSSSTKSTFFASVPVAWPSSLASWSIPGAR